MLCAIDPSSGPKASTTSRECFMRVLLRQRRCADPPVTLCHERSGEALEEI